jgi:hypothetical protein
MSEPSHVWPQRPTSCGNYGRIQGTITPYYHIKASLLQL